MKQKAIQEMIRMETHASFPFLIEITEPNGTITRYANSDNDITFEGNVYTASCFSITPPERKMGGMGNAKLSMSIIDQVWIEKIRNTQERSKIRFLAVIMYDNEENEVEVEPIDDLEFILTSANWDMSKVEWTMVFDDLNDILIPSDECDSVICPALV